MANFAVTYQPSEGWPEVYGPFKTSEEAKAFMEKDVKWNEVIARQADPFIGKAEFNMILNQAEIPNWGRWKVDVMIPPEMVKEMR